jgi:hypothetical protein
MTDIEKAELLAGQIEYLNQAVKLAHEQCYQEQVKTAKFKELAKGLIMANRAHNETVKELLKTYRESK